MKQLQKKNQKIICIIQARMGSTRLPGKVLLEGGDRKPLLVNLYERLSKSRYLDKIIIATTNLKNDNKIVKVCKQFKISYFRGNNLDVLDRYYQCALKFKGDIILRVTADCPLLEFRFVDKFINFFCKKKYNFLTNGNPRTFPKGFDLEIFDFKTLKKCKENAKLRYDKEHVTPHIRKNLYKFKLGNFKNKSNLYKKYRLTLDYKNDYLVIKEIYNNLYNKNKIFNLNKIIKFLDKSKINSLNIKHN